MSDLNLTRRHLFCTAAAVAIAPSMPAYGIPAPPPQPLMLFPAWQVGHEDVMNWRVIFAETAERAMQIYREDIGTCQGCDGLRCAEIDTDGDCEFAGLDAYKASEKIIPPSDVEGEHGLTEEEMNRLGWQHHCDRHNDVCEEWQLVARGDKREIVCDDCMEVEDWEIVNPSYAAELRADRRALEDADFAESFGETLQDFFRAAP